MGMFCCCEVTVGFGESDERDQSAPTQTASQQVGVEADEASARLNINTRGRTEAGVWDRVFGVSWFGRAFITGGLRMLFYNHFIFRVSSHGRGCTLWVKRLHTLLQ